MLREIWGNARSAFTRKAPRGRCPGLVVLFSGLGALGLATAAASEIVVHPGDDIQAIVQAAPEGESFRFAPGTYRLYSIQPKNRQKFRGTLGPNRERLSVINGSRHLPHWTRQGDVWYATGQTQEQGSFGTCDPGRGMCNRPEDVFIDDVTLEQVGSLSQVGPSSFYFDYGADRIYIGTDPSVRVVEASVTQRAFYGPADDVEIRDLVVEKYSNHAQWGAIDAQKNNDFNDSLGLRWKIINNEVRLNHGTGIRAVHNSLVDGNYVHHNGQKGIGGRGNDIRILNNEIAYNNLAGYKVDWEGGATKFTGSERLEAAYNYVHHNFGPGLWTDEVNVNVHFHHNLITDNTRPGIYHEISYNAEFDHNVVMRNGFAHPDWGWGAGIAVSSSRGVEIHHNEVLDNADGITAMTQARGSGPLGVYEISDLNVHNNCVRQPNNGFASAMLQDVGDASYFCCKNNRFSNNVYDVDPGRRLFAWNNAERHLGEWESFHPDEIGVGRCGLLFSDGFENGAGAWAEAVGAGRRMMHR